MAFEDVVVLSRELSTGADLQSAIERYEAIRKPRTARIQERARRNGQLFHQPHGLKRTFTLGSLAMVNRIAPSLITRQLDWIYAFRPA